MQQEYTKFLANQRIFIEKFKVFPEQSRKPIYLQVLKLPLNYRHYSQLNKNYSILIDHTLQKDVSQIVAAIINCYPDLKIQWLPGIIYPFIKLFKKDSLAQFQISLTYLVNWCSPWFSDYPAPAIKIVQFMGKNLKILEKSVNDTGVSLAGLVWPMFLVNFTDVLNKDDWLELLDYIILRPQKPWLLLTFIIELLKFLQCQLTKCKTIEKMHCLLRKERKTNIKSIIKAGIKLAQANESKLKQIYSQSIFPLCKDRYPILKFISNQAKLKNMVKEHQQSNLKKLEEQVGEVQNLLLNKQNDLLSSNKRNLNNYSEKLEMALRNHLEITEETHDRKLKAFKQVEMDFRNCLQKNQYFRQKQTQNIKDYIHKRSVLQKAISQSKKQAETIKRMQINTLQKLKQALRIKEAEEKQMYVQLHTQIHKRK